MESRTQILIQGQGLAHQRLGQAHTA